jgi:hypothetical protein
MKKRFWTSKVGKEYTNLGLYVLGLRTVDLYTIQCLSVVQQNMRVTRRILTLLTKVLYKFGCFKRILKKSKLALVLFY